MKTATLTQILVVLHLTVFCLLPAAFCLGQDADMNKEPWNTLPSNAPAEKVQKWEELRKVIDKEYDVCLEHCGYEKSCESKCEKTYRRRLSREYDLLFSGK